MDASTHTRAHTNLDDSYDMLDNSPSMTRSKTKTKITITASTNPPLCSLALGFFKKKRKKERHKSREI